MESDARPLACAAPVGCPLCRKKLSVVDRAICCPACERTDCPREFRFTGGFPDLIVGERFEDQLSDAQIDNEEINTQHTVRNYWLPLFRRVAGGIERPKVLALGCGAGAEVDLLRQSGFDCVGIDNGNRTRAWAQREAPDALVLANAMSLPFPDGYFDIAFCGCVFPHVGVVDDSSHVSEKSWEDRLAVAREMTRVVKPGGHIFVSSPNRWFPFDLFHGRKSGSFRTPFNPPWSRFLLAASDYRRILLEAGCAGPARAISIRNYWGFGQMKKSLLGRLASVPVKALLFLGSNAVTRMFRTSALVPWIVIGIRK